MNGWQFAVVMLAASIGGGLAGLVTYRYCRFGPRWAQRITMYLTAVLFAQLSMGFAEWLMGVT